MADEVAMFMMHTSLDLDKLRPVTSEVFRKDADSA